MIHKKNKNKKTSKIWKAILILLGVIFFLVCAALVTFVMIQISEAPDISEINASPEGYLTTIYDVDENEIEKLYVTESNRIYVDLEEIPDLMEKAFVAIEDERFYDHFGIDIKGIIRAGIHGLTTGSFSQGASTITQQLLKNNVFTGWMEEETFYDKICRKIQEQYLAVRLEQEYSKDWILENYLNTINLGGGTRGVQVAAQYYFGKNVSELTLAESALIAGITKNPTAYNPLKNPDKSIERQHLVLENMLRNEYISQEEYEQALAEDVLGALAEAASKDNVRIFSWFEDTLLNQVVDDLMEQYSYTEEAAWDLVYSGGLKIYSTQDSELQTICETVASSSEWYTGDEEVSIVMTDVTTGAVAAIVGGREEKTSSLVYNRATDSVRQPGSTIKIIGEYAAVIDGQGATLGTVIDDAPYTYSDGTSLGNSYDTYKGMTTIRDAIASSSNVVALKAYQMAGEDLVFEYLDRFGITTLTAQDRNEAVSIGGTYNGVTNLEMTAAYNAIANDGIYIQPYYYTKVVDRDGQILLKNDGSGQRVLEKESADLLTLAMEEVISSGTGRGTGVDGISLAGKTGTTNENKDLWFVGFSGYYTCGVWGGFDNNAAQENSKYVKQIWQEVMEQAHAEKEDRSLVDTSELTSVSVCKKCGNLAIEGMCDDTVQGDMTETEYFAAGTEPKQYCDCHVKLTTCEESGKLPGLFCPSDSRVTKVYLKAGTEGTADADYILPENSEESCDVHASFLDHLFGNGTEDPEDSNGSNGPNAPNNPVSPDIEPDGSNEPESEEPSAPGNWWENIYGQLFGD